MKFLQKIIKQCNTQSNRYYSQGPWFVTLNYSALHHMESRFASCRQNILPNQEMLQVDQSLTVWNAPSFWLHFSTLWCLCNSMVNLSDHFVQLCRKEAMRDKRNSHTFRLPLERMLSNGISPIFTFLS